MNKPQVIIVGGGAAGLIAATVLCEKCAVIVIESKAELGGRIKSIPLEEGEGVIETGAEFIHGDLPITNELVKEAGLKTVKVSGKMLRKEGKAWSEQQDMIEGWDELVEKMKGQRSDMTMQDFMKEHFSGEKYEALRRHIKLFVNGFDLADPAKISVQSLYKEWSNEDEQFRLKEGYGSVIAYLEKKASAKGCEFHLGDPVRQIDWQKDDVTIYTAGGKKYNAARCLITVPVSIMTDISSSRSINLTPPVDEYIQAYRNIGYGSVIKLVFDFKERFWRNDMGFVFSDEMIPTWWSHYPLKNNLLTGWGGGPVADQLSFHSDEEICTIGLTSLAHIFDKSIDELQNNVRKSFVFNWSANENALGAYSFSTPDSEEAKKVLNTPLAETVYFAGEGLFEGEYPGTVEAAFDSGRSVAALILKHLG